MIRKIRVIKTIQELIKLDYEEILNGINPKGIKEIKYHFGGVNIKFQFENEYQVSLIKHRGSYGRQNGKWEMVIMDKDNDFVFDTPITNDVLGYLDEKEVNEYLDKVKKLKKRK